MIRKSVSDLVEHGVRTFTIKLYQFSQFKFGSIVVVTDFSVEGNVFFFKITDIFQIIINVEQHLFDLGNVDISAQFVVVDSLARIVDIILIFKDQPLVVFQQVVFFGGSEFKATTQFLFQFFVTLM